MKILMYSDVHISRTSSIIPLGDDKKFTYRQKMIIDTAEFIAKKADELKVDIIINLGDTFDQHTLTSYDIETASEFFSKFRYLSIPHLVLVGNHEMINSNYNAIKLLDNITNITVIDKPCSVKLNSLFLDNNSLTEEQNMKLAFLPYKDFRNINELPEGDFLISHNDIQGSELRKGIQLPDGLTQDQLKQYKIVFNGHIHKSGIFNNVVNVGSCTSHSFSDDNDFIPKIYVFDTVTLDLQSYKSNICPLFRAFKIKNLQDLTDILNACNKDYVYIFNIQCPYELKDAVKSVLKDDTAVLNYKVTTYITEESKSVKIDSKDKLDSLLGNMDINLDMNVAFKQFLSNIDLKFPSDMYLEVLNKGEEVLDNAN